MGGFLFLLLFPLCLAAKEYELIPDPAMRRGVKLLAPKAVNGVGVPIDTLRFDSNRKHPMWNLCSWDFKTQLSGRHPEQTDTYGIAYVDDAFTFARTDEGVFTMRADAETFYRVVKEAAASLSDPLELVYPGEVPYFDKYDEFVPEELIRKGFAYGVLDVEGMVDRVLGWPDAPKSDQGGFLPGTDHRLSS